jgi:NADPH-dependent ferric siderophore reductase
MADPPRTRREPPRFRRVSVREVELTTPYLARVTLAGSELIGFTVDQPAASVRLLLPTPDTAELVMPTWDGNVFLLPDGERATIRTFTPPLTASAAEDLSLDVVIHEGGAASSWVQQAGVGDQAAISGPGRGYAIEPGAEGFLLAGDETAMPAIRQLLGAVPDDRPVHVLIEVGSPEARLSLPDHPLATIEWLDRRPGTAPGAALVEAVAAAAIGPDRRVWAAGEAGAMQRIRRHLFEERGIPRAAATVRGYWKLRQTGT